MNEYPLVWILIGVSGSGKTTVGRHLSKHLECDFLEGDRRHSRANIIKMIAQQTLEDEDRVPWLLDIEEDIRRAISRDREIVITCSALKASYRKQLYAHGRVQLILIDVDLPVLQQRLQERTNHYMSAEMLPSQCAAFEVISPEEQVITVNGNSSMDIIMNELITEIIQRFPIMKKSWWQRYID
jgi:gluconokinase